ncbi:tripartite tricarboxylate transporter substrate binding protein [Roseomonas terrae]|uniref:Tripartite tricarboxylate transporter substrate binding protein n=1 Tax=Neoroseomonas terrae TaxID=424799 RepID=A0ABS5EIK2_9PROT|nr:tripartite tricarboxylate transporter substrate binding protein [Neoroseomonas terrae]MBR0650852.1 tripartite tricarboxylate transporter substrate binding protein [Neoroseomonas terrae]
MTLSRRHALAGLAALLPLPALARDDWPTRPIRLIIPFPPGGSSDLAARLMADRLGAKLGQPVVCDNRPGASGIIGTEAVVRSAPDGYTLLYASVGNAAINYPLYGARLPYRPSDLTGVGLIAAAPNLIVVRSDSPFRTLGDLVAFARANPDKLNFGTTGLGSSVQMTGALLAASTGIEVTTVNYRGGGQVVQELIAGTIDYAADGITASAGHIRDGLLRGLAVTQQERSAALPDVPTTVEAGFPEVLATAWFSILAPAATPRAIVDRVGAEMQAALEEPTVQERLASLGGGPLPLPLPGGRTTPAAFDAFIREEIGKWTAVVERTGLRAQ